jgi:phosphonate metabolism protein (transferase hexapeptide repeat family)
MIKYLIAKFLKKIRLSSVKKSKIARTSKIGSGSNVANSTMDRYSFCGYDCDINNAVIGSFCSIASNVRIGGAMHPVDWVSMSPVFYSGRDSVKKKFSRFDRPADKTTHIGSDVWIGDGAFIKQGVNIGVGAVIGMGSVVTKDVPPYTIVAGNPARVIRKRFNDDIINRLLESRWWEMSDNQLKTLAVDIKDPESFLNKL